MKNIFFGLLHLKLPNLGGCTGFGSIDIDDNLYYEYQYKLIELLKLSEKIHEIAQEQLKERYPRGY